MSEGMSLSQINRPTINMDNTNVANNPNDKASGEEYFSRRGQNQPEEEMQQSPFVDRAAQLRATLNSLAALNAASVVKAKDKYKNKIIKDKTELQDNSERVLKINEEEQNQEHKENSENQEPKEEIQNNIENDEKEVE